jgi:signal transduction histidine kinase
MSDAADPSRSLITLQRLLEIPAGDTKSALTHACNALADSLAADKVDAFLYDEPRDSLVAVGTSTQPLSNLQKRLGLDVLPVSNGGRVVHVYRTGEVFRHGDLLADAEELRGVKEGLRIRSKLGIPLIVGGERRGMVMIASLQPGYFTEADETFARSAVHWVGMVAHRAELIADIEQNAVAQGRRTAAEELVTVLAHDLRNYIAPVSGRLYTLRHRAESDNRVQDLEDIAMALAGMSRLSGLIGNLLDVARLDRGLFDLDLEAVDLVAMAREAAATLATSEHEIVVSASDAVIVAGDPARLRQCIDNLLANAVNHSPRMAPVNVFLSRIDIDATAFGQVEVRDEGPGIPEEVLPTLFERFATGRGKEGGLGLGLYLARRIAAAHGGDITAQQAPGKGACFRVRVPLYQQAA